MTLSDTTTHRDTTPRYAPSQVLMLNHGMVPVTSYIAHPANNHPDKCPIKAEYVALELRTPFGSRWYGCDHAYINSELRMVVIGTDTRDEVRMQWRVVPDNLR
jgi:hypothetical protein